MKFTVPMALATLCVALTTASDAGSVIQALRTVNGTVQQLSADVPRYRGGVQGFPYALQVQQDANEAFKASELALIEANGSPAFGSQSSNVSSTLLGLSNTVTKALQNTQAKNATFGELKPIVRLALYQLKNTTNQVANAIVPKLNSAEQALAPGVIQRLNTAFNSAIVAYGGKAT